jgi:hypothetical protein
MAKVDVRLFGYYLNASCSTCRSFEDCGGQAHSEDDGGLKRSLLEKYGDRIQVSLTNVFAPEMQNYPEVAACVKKNGLLLPIVTVEGEVKLIGSEATLQNIYAAVDAALSRHKGVLSIFKH